MAEQPNGEKRQRRERGSINPDDIIDGAFEFAEAIGIDNLSMPLLGKHLGVGVTSIYWYFRKKDDLLSAMTDRALRQYVFATPYVAADDWRQTLANHAYLMRETFLGNPILCDLILIRSALSPRAAKLGVAAAELAIRGLVEAGLSPEDAFEIYSAMSLHIRGAVVLQRLEEKNRVGGAESGDESGDESGEVAPTVVVDPTTAPLLAQVSRTGRRVGVSDDHGFEFGLNCILDHAERLIAAATSTPRSEATAT